MSWLRFPMSKLQMQIIACSYLIISTSTSSNDLWKTLKHLPQNAGQGVRSDVPVTNRVQQLETTGLFEHPESYKLIQERCAADPVKMECRCSQGMKKIWSVKSATLNHVNVISKNMPKDDIIAHWCWYFMGFLIGFLAACYWSYWW